MSLSLQTLSHIKEYAVGPDQAQLWPYLARLAIAELMLEHDRLSAEVARLKAGKLTSEEFNELCHNQHESGFPLTREQHRDACDRFRDGLFRVGGVSEVQGDATP